MIDSSKTIVIVVAPDGQATVETRGFSGSSCQQASRFIEQALGRAVNEQLTGEFYQSNNVGQHESQHQ